MKFSENWLREWVNPPISTDELIKQLTMAGLEVDSVEPVATLFNQVVIGEVLSIEPHPDAKKLRVCQVNVGQKKPLKIVCGASNVQIGMRVPTALIGACLNELKIKPTTLRGIESSGMLCSAQELGLAESSDGLLPLPNDAPIGEDLRRYFQLEGVDLEDVGIEIDLTPNRGDCLGIEGIAREVGVLSRSKVKPPFDGSPIAPTISDTFSVVIKAPEACPRYVGRIIKNINAQAQTPLWIQERLRRCGLRSISAVVDVTNYVLLELGQPMHAFDLAGLAAGIQVRMAKAGESLALLDEQTVKLDEQTLIIADHKQPLAMAGVMGGLSSAVTTTTQNLFLESAFFTPKYASGTARRYGLHTDSSHRFERGVDPHLQSRAMERATALLLDIVGGQPGPVIEVADQAQLPIIHDIKLRLSQIKRLLGLRALNKLNKKRQKNILVGLGMQCDEMLREYSKTGQLLKKPQFEGWKVRPPSYRFDLALEADLIEELARIHGYNNLPSHAPQTRLMMSSQPAVSLEQVQAVLVERDYQEAITYSFVDPKLQEQLDPAAQSITLANPIASDMAVMRTTLWASLVPVLLYNQKRQQSRGRFFETGLRFIYSKEQVLQQEPMIAGVAMGTRWPGQWGQPSQQIDFFDIKSDVEAVLKVPAGTLQADEMYHFTPTTHPALHPGQTAAIYRGDEWLGVLGALHPRLVQTLELTPPIYLFELRLTSLSKAQPIKFKEISKYPSIRRDLAIVVSKTVSATQLLDCIKQSATDLLIDGQLFDVYQGKGLEPTQKSIAIGLIFQAFSRSLTDSEVDRVVEQIVSTLEHKLGATLRK